MKGLIIVVAVAIIGVQAFSIFETAKLLMYHRNCLSASGVDSKLVQKARKGDLVDDPKLKDYIFCFSKKLGFQNNAGELQNNAMIKKLKTQVKDVNKMENVVAQCAVQKDTPQQTIFEAITCYNKNSPVPLSFA